MGASDDDPDEITVLHVDGYEAFTTLSTRLLHRASGRLTVETARTAREAADAVRTGEPDCVVSAYDLPGPDGLALLEWVRATRPGTPFVLFTGCREPGLRTTALCRGATAVLWKETDPGQFATLADRVVAAVSAERARTADAPTDGVAPPGDPPA